MVCHPNLTTTTSAIGGSMRRSTSRILCLVATTLLLASIAVNVTIFWDKWKGSPHPSFAHRFDYTALAPCLLAAVLLDYIVYIDALCKLARQREWGWLAFLWLTVTPTVVWPLVMMPFYLLVGPKEQAVTMGHMRSDGAHGGDQGAEPMGRSSPLSHLWTFLPGSRRYASGIERAAAAAIDLSTFQIAGFVMGLAVNVPLQSGRMSRDFGASIVQLILVLLIAYLFIFCFIFVLWPAQWARRGQTIGQRALGIRVVSTSGQRIRFGTAFVRVVSLFTIAVPFGIPIGWAWVFIDPKRQGWHDKIAHTIVVRDSTA